MNRERAESKIVLIGAGHTHLGVLQSWRRAPVTGAKLTLISATEFATYSGMLPGVLAGRYEPVAMSIHLPPVAEGAGAELIVDPAIALDSAAKTVTLQSGRVMPFDIASVGIGSIPSLRELWDGVPGVVAVKPMATFLDRLDVAVEAAVKHAAASPEPLPISIAVVGAGAAGVEIACCLQQRLDAQQIAASILLIDAGEDILAGYRPRTVALAREALLLRGILLRMKSRITDVQRYQQPERHGVELRFADGDCIVPNVVIWATSAAPPPVLENFNLPKAADGFLAVEPTLQSTGKAPLFAVGDTATIEKSPCPKAGVYAVREAPVLWRNIQRLLAGQQLVSYRPQRGFLSLLNTGDGRAILEYRRCSSHSRWAWALKNRIDQRFMRMVRET